MNVLTNTRICRTVFKCATDHHGSRIVATHLTTGQRVTFNYDHALSVSENHIAAARALFAKYPAYPESMFTDDFLDCGERGGAMLFVQLPHPDYMKRNF